MASATCGDVAGLFVSTHLTRFRADLEKNGADLEIRLDRPREGPEVRLLPYA
jgi:hypothetical protein